MTEILDLVGASKYLKLTKNTVYKYARLGQIPSFKLGKQWRFKQDVLDAWLDKQMNLRTPVEKKETSSSDKKRAPKSKKQVAS